MIISSLSLSGGLTVRYNDFRRFGSFAVCSTESLGTHPALLRLGIDALSTELNGEVLFELLRGKKTPIKTSLLDQSLIAGIGNMYACEILYWSDIHPTRPSGSLSRSETDKVTCTIHRILAAAVESGGSTLPDYAGTSGALGSFHHHFAVFGRQGFSCPRCDVPLRVEGPIEWAHNVLLPNKAEIDYFRMHMDMNALQIAVDSRSGDRKHRIRDGSDLRMLSGFLTHSKQPERLS